MKPQGWVLYDGGCGFCSRWIGFWAPTLMRVGLGTAPLRADWVRNRTGLPEEVLLRDIRVLMPDGSLASGADAYFYCMKRISWARPIALLFELPMLNTAFRYGYRKFANNRMRISRACRLHPPTHERSA